MQGCAAAQAAAADGGGGRGGRAHGSRHKFRAPPPCCIAGVLAFSAKHLNMPSDLVRIILQFAQERWEHEWYSIPAPRGGPFQCAINGPVTGSEAGGHLFCFGGCSATEGNGLWRLRPETAGGAAAEWQLLQPSRAGPKVAYLCAQSWDGSTLCCVSLRRDIVNGQYPVLNFRWAGESWAAETVRGSWPEPRSGHTLTATPFGHVVFGGESAGRVYSDCWALCEYPKGLSWRLLDAPVAAAVRPDGRTRHAAVCTQGPREALWIHGGCCRGFFMQDLWSWDSRLGWRRRGGGDGDTQRQPSSRADHTLVEHNGRLLLYGGIGDGGLLGDAWLFCPQSDLWRQVVPLGGSPAPRRSPCVAVRDDELLVWGGRDRHGQTLADMHRMTLTGRVQNRPARESTSEVLARRARHQGAVAAAIHGCYHQPNAPEAPLPPMQHRRRRKAEGRSPALPSQHAWLCHIDRGY